MVTGSSHALKDSINDFPLVVCEKNKDIKPCKHISSNRYRKSFFERHIQHRAGEFSLLLHPHC